MEALITLFVFAMIFAIPILKAIFGTSEQRSMNRLMTSGTQARALVLSASSVATNVVFNGAPYQRRSLVLDVEEYGKPPYQVSVSPLIPRQLSRFVLPGTSLDLRVDPTNRQNLLVIGPGGVFFTN